MSNHKEPPTPLQAVEPEFCHRPPLHFVLKLKNLCLLGAARWPDVEPTWWKGLSSLGFRWVICAASDNPPYNPSPLEFLQSLELEDLSGGKLPTNRTAEFEKIAEIAAQAYSKLKEGGILIHCAGGRGRAGTIIGAMLLHCGYGPKEIIDFLDTAYQGAGRPGGWPEGRWQSGVIKRLHRLL